MTETQTKNTSTNSARICQNCKNQFVIEPDDFGFYEKIQVPPPTWCPTCRQQRRYAWRNERTLYRRNCDLCSKSTVTIYSPNKPHKVYCPPCWWGDGWSAGEYAQDFDFSRPFFDQFHELQLKVPRIALLIKNSVNSEYTNHSGDSKDCYLCFSVFNGENDMYCTDMYGKAPTRDCIDCYHITNGGELLYECVDGEQCYACQFSLLMRGCSDCSYCFDCRGCSNCFLSYNLRNKQYYVLNKPYTKEAYKEEMKKINLCSHVVREELYAKWRNLMHSQALHRFAIIENSVNVSGNHVLNSRNANNAFDSNDMEDVRHVTLCIDAKNSMDSYHFGITSELIYETHGLVRGYNTRFTHLCYDDVDLTYCDTCHNSEHLFGCVGVKKGKYMILNKAYEESEYELLKGKIVEHMKKNGEYGEFFPPRIAPVSYNETQGQVYMPLTKEEVLRRGWKWEDQLPGTFGKETMPADKIPDAIQDVPDAVTKEIFKCGECSKNYNIVAPELLLYRRGNIPIPRICPDCRYKRKIMLRTPRRLWNRRCMCDYTVRENTLKHAHHPEGRCPNEFETPYDPQRKELVYCGLCYQSEIT